MTDLTVRWKKLAVQMGEAKLVAVSKNVPASSIRILYRAGQRHFAENKVQELIKKAHSLSDLSQIIWHFVGTLQSNKVSSLFQIPCLYYIHSIDSLKLLSLIHQKKHLLVNSLTYFLQINIAGEKEKKGFASYEIVKDALIFIKKEKCTLLKFAGLMAMGKFRTDKKEEDARDCFVRLRHMKEKLEQDFSIKDLKLSMGMSGDYKIALEEGADFVRIGKAVFAED